VIHVLRNQVILLIEESTVRFLLKRPFVTGDCRSTSIAGCQAQKIADCHEWQKLTQSGYPQSAYI
jgi:hypothetical protein